jgi:integrase
MRSGSLKEIRPSVYRLRFDLPPDPATGKRRQGTATVEGSRRDAEKELARRLAGETDSSPAKLTLAAYLDQWQAANRKRLAPNTVRTYGYMVERLTARLGAVLLTRLSPYQIQEHYAQELEEQAASSVNLQHAVLRRALRQARRWKLLDYNPTDDVDPPRFVPPEIRALGPADLSRLMDAAGPALRPALVLAILSGIRRGELLGLQWSDLDWEAGRLLVQRQLRLGETGLEYGPPKSRAGRRSLTLPVLALEELTAHQRRQEGLRRETPTWQEFGLIFPREDGRPWHPSTFGNRYRTLRAVAGFPEVRLHDLRHAALTLLHALGVPQKVVMARAGHASPAMTNRYLHTLPGQDEDAAERLERAFRDTRRATEG